jgi:hypothetical protein
MLPCHFRGDGDGDGVRKMQCKYKDKRRALATFHHAEVVDKKKRVMIDTMTIIYDCGCVVVSRVPIQLLDDELLMKWIR